MEPSKQNQVNQNKVNDAQSPVAQPVEQADAPTEESDIVLPTGHDSGEEVQTSGMSPTQDPVNEETPVLPLGTGSEDLEQNADVQHAVQEPIPKTVSVTPSAPPSELAEEHMHPENGKQPSSQTAAFLQAVTDPKFQTKQTLQTITQEMSPSNFWLDGNYKRVVKRIEDGGRLVDDLAKMIKERAEIEVLYANKLKAWEKKWQEVAQKSPEYGTLADNSKKGLSEGVWLADTHMSVYGRLEELSRSVHAWKEENNPKSLMKYKEVKRSDEAFSKAQKPWVAKYNEANKCMKAYHTARQMADLASEQEKEAKLHPETTPEQLAKLADKVRKTANDVEVTRDKYKDSIRDISNYNSKYIEDMNYEYKRCQDFEERRRIMVKAKLLDYKSCIDRMIFTDTYRGIYHEVESLYNAVDHVADLEWYTNAYGNQHPFIAMEYVEYNPAVHGRPDIAKQRTPEMPRKVVGSAETSKKGKSSVCTAL